ncbi:MAG: hypothetical protein ABI865_06880 [Nitrosospira sp.]
MNKFDESASQVWSRIRLYLNRNFILSLSLYGALGAVIIFAAISWNDTHERHQQQIVFQISQKIQDTTVSGKTGKTSDASENRISGKTISELLDELNSRRSVGPELLRDIGIALLIAAFVTAIIERYASDRLRENIAYDVLSAAYAKIVPEPIYRQIADSVFRAPVYRRNWDVRIDVHTRTEGHKEDGIVIIDCFYSYDIENLNEKEIIFNVKGAIDLDVVEQEMKLPCYKSISVISQQLESLIEVSIPETTAGKLLMPGADETIKDETRKKEVHMRRRDDQVVFTTPVRIPSRQSVAVSFHVKRAIWVPGTFVIYANVPADGIKITIEGKELEFGISPLHPNADALRNPTSGVWRFDCGILPWQGFQVRCNKKPSKLKSSIST